MTTTEQLLEEIGNLPHVYRFSLQRRTMAGAFLPGKVPMRYAHIGEYPDLWTWCADVGVDPTDSSALLRYAMTANDDGSPCLREIVLEAHRTLCRASAESLERHGPALVDQEVAEAANGCIAQRTAARRMRDESEA